MRRSTRVPTRADRVDADRMRRVGRRVETPDCRVMPSPRLERILVAVRTALTMRKAVSLADDGIDLCFLDGVEARCRACGVAWRVSRTHYRSLSWWACPSGCESSVKV